METTEIATAGSFTYMGKAYEIDHMGFLINPYSWDENFAEGTANTDHMSLPLSESHWKVIQYIRDTYTKTHRCPIIYSACKELNLNLKELRDLFPTGYQRGACKIAGVSYREAEFPFNVWFKTPSEGVNKDVEKTYRIDTDGFLVDPKEWDRSFALMKARELKMATLLSEEQWEIIDSIRDIYFRTGVLPNVYEACLANKIDLEDMERLFPDGYHRGAVKLSGLRLR